MLDEPGFVYRNVLTISLTLILLGFVLYRLIWVTKLDFPIHDGGLFYLIIRQIELGNFALPWSIPYNHENIPFAYPPFGLYFAAVLDSASGIGPLTILRIVPMVVSSLSLLAVFLLGRSIFQSIRMAILTAFIFLFTPLSMMWSTMGGGITRSFGLLFSLLALWQVHRLYLTNQKAQILPVSIFCALTILSHPENAWFLFYSIAIFWWFFGRNKSGVINSIIVFLLTFVMILPWIYVVYSRHGMTIIQPFIESGSTLHQNLISLLYYNFTGEFFFPLIKYLCLIGIVACLFNQRYFLPVWFLATFFLQIRAPEHRASIVIALLSAVAISYVVIPVSNILQNERHRRLLLVSFLTLFAIYLPINAQRSLPIYYKPLSHAELEAIEWVKQYTPENARFATVQSHLWFADHHSEWLSALGERKCQNLVQGYEWLPNFTDRIEIQKEFVSCGKKDVDCLYNWMNKNGLTFEYIFLVKECIHLDNPELNSCEPLYHALLVSPYFDTIYENSDVAIFAMH